MTICQRQVLCALGVFFSLLWCPEAFSEPKGMGDMGENKLPRKLVLVCYTGGRNIERKCDHVRARVRNHCKPPIEIVEIKDEKGNRLHNPTPDQVTTSLKRESVPRNSLVMVIGHAILTYDKDPKHEDKIVPVHNLSAENKTTVHTETLLSRIQEELDEPSIYLGACHAGMACGRGCVGGMCASDQTAQFGTSWGMEYPDDLRRLSRTSPGEETMSSPQTNRILDLMCSEEAFKAADQGDPKVKGDAKENDGVLEGEELNADLCRLPESRRYFDFFVDTHRFDEADKIVEIPKEDREKQIARFRERIRSTLTYEMGKKMESEWGFWRRQRATAEREMAETAEIHRKIDRLEGEIQELRTKYRALEEGAERDTLRRQHNRKVEEFNDLTHDYNRRFDNMATSGDNRILMSRWQLMQDEYGSVDDIMKNLEVIEDKDEAETVLTLRNRRTGKETRQNANYRMRFYLPKPKSSNACIWTSKDAFATPQLSRLKLYFTPSRSRPRDKRTAPGGEEQGPDTPEHNPQ